MLVLVIVLVVTNLATLGLLVWFHVRPAEHPDLDPAVARLLSPGLRPPSSSSGGTRRFITIEILNPIELAGTRGRLAGIAGSLAPGITRRIVYDQALKMVRRHLADEHVVADVRLHVSRPLEAPDRSTAPTRSAAPSRPTTPSATRPSHDEPVDLIKHDEPDPPP